MIKWYNEEYESEIEGTWFIRSGGDLENICGIGEYSKDILCL